MRHRHVVWSRPVQTLWCPRLRLDAVVRTDYALRCGAVWDLSHPSPPAEAAVQSSPRVSGKLMVGRPLAQHHPRRLSAHLPKSDRDRDEFMRSLRLLACMIPVMCLRRQLSEGLNIIGQPRMPLGLGEEERYMPLLPPLLSCRVRIQQPSCPPSVTSSNSWRKRACDASSNACTSHIPHRTASRRTRGPSWVQLGPEAKAQLPHLP